MNEDRPLTQNEREALARVLDAASFEGASELRAQLGTVRVSGGLKTFLELSVYGDGAPASDCPDGPIPLRALVHGEDGEVTGELLVWVKRGFLSGFEHAWVTDEMPEEFPRAEQIRT